MPPELIVAELKVQAVGFLEDPRLNARVLVLSERKDGTGGRLEIQRAIVEDPGDEGTYCLVIDGDITHYGGIARWDLSPTALTLTLTDEAGVAIGASALVLGIADAKHRALVQQHLPELLGFAAAAAA